MTSLHTNTREKLASCDCSRTIEQLRGRLDDERQRTERIATDLQLKEEQERGLLRQIAALKREIAKREKASVPESEVQDVWATFVDVVAVRKTVVLDDARRKMIRDRIRDIRQAPNVQEDPVQRLKRALHGLAKKPYVRHGGGRTGDPKNAKRYAGLQHALRDMQAVEACIGYLEEPAEPTPIRRSREPDPFDRPVDRVLTALTQHDCSYRAAWGGDGQVRDGAWMAQCPAHEDREPSLSIRETGDRVLLNCFASCHIVDVVEALGLNLSDLFVRSAA